MNTRCYFGAIMLNITITCIGRSGLDADSNKRIDIVYKIQCSCWLFQQNGQYLGSGYQQVRPSLLPSDLFEII